LYHGDRLADNKPLALSPALQTALVVSVVGILIVGVYPQPLISLSQQLIQPLVEAAGALALK
jgi:NADH:ubiquinone oxidoreductase subunit 4 (subunit M)